MSLVIDLQITNNLGGLNDIGRLIIRRLEPLDNPGNPTEEVHTYEAHVLDKPPVQLEHRYGDGGWHLTKLAIEALEL